MALRADQAQRLVALRSDQAQRLVALRSDQAQRLVALCVAGCLLLSYPLLALFNRPLRLAGLPLAVLYLFGVWALLIALMAWVTRRGGGRDGPSTPP